MRDQPIHDVPDVDGLSSAAEESADGLELRLGRFLYDSWQDAPDAAQRSALSANSIRQLAYATEGGDVSVSVMRLPNRATVAVHGQFLMHDDQPPAKFDVRLLKQSELLENASSDDFGEFYFEAVDPGAYRLILSTEAMNVLIPEIELRA